MRAEAPASTVARSLARVEQELLARWPKTRTSPTLDRIKRLLSLLGEPHTAYASVHITGTNGKSSTARLVEALLSESGSRTGGFTSPHLTSIRDRISLDGRAIGVEQFLSAHAAVAACAERVDSVSFFEMMVAMAYHAFARHRVEVAVVEVGIGGRRDATNVIDAGVATILPIALDHAHILGHTTTHVAAEKAGIIKPGCTAVVARQEPDVERVLRARAAVVGARVVFEDRDFAVTSRTPDEHGQVVSVHGRYGTYEDLRLSLRGRHQAQNAAVAITTVEAVRGGPIRQETVRAALRRVTAPGRFEVRPGSPSLVLDVAHNPHGAASLVAALAELGAAWTVGVIAVMNGKDHAGLLRRLEPAIDVMVCTRNSSSRCVPAADLAACARTIFGTDRVHVARDVAAGLAVAAELGRQHGVPAGDVRILVTGSVVTVGDVSR